MPNTTTISVLYFAGCPNHQPVVEMARRLIDEHRLDAVVEEVELTDPADAASLRFLGSPTVQVDGVDIEPAARDRADFAMSCRVYPAPDGLPTERMFLDALGVTACAANNDATGATKNTVARAGALATAGSVLTAMLSSACCWLPLTLIAFGASAGGLGAFFQRWRPYFIALSITMLAAGFYFAYFRATACDGGGCARRMRRRRKLRRAVLWASSAVVLAFVMFPRYSASLVESIHGQATIDSSLKAGDAAATGAVYVFDVKGMTCQACATALKSELSKIPGVTNAQASYADKTARVRADDPAVTKQVEKVARSLGYTASPALQQNKQQEKSP